MKSGNLQNSLYAAALALVLMAVAGLSGCRVHVDKDAKGQEKTVQVDTPFGGVHVNTDQTSAADLGLPVYPGAKPIRGDDKHKSADVHLGFGDWQLRVKAVSYGTPDSKDKVSAFYKKALARFGDVRLIVRVNGARQAVLRVVGNLECVIEIPRLRYSQNGAKDLFLKHTGL